MQTFESEYFKRFPNVDTTKKASRALQYIGKYKLRNSEFIHVLARARCEELLGSNSDYHALLKEAHATKQFSIIEDSGEMTVQDIVCGEIDRHLFRTVQESCYFPSTVDRPNQSIVA